MSKINKSYGIICKYNNTFIMIQRLNSIEYFNIITGKYKTLEELEIYFNNITKEEWESIKKIDDFDTIWSNLWNKRSVKYTLIQKNKFFELKKIINLFNLSLIHI